MRCPALAQEDVLVEEFLHEGDDLDAELGGQDVAGGDEELLAEVRHLMGTNFQEGEHTTHHLRAVSAHDLHKRRVREKSSFFPSKFNPTS